MVIEKTNKSVSLAPSLIETVELEAKSKELTFSKYTEEALKEKLNLSNRPAGINRITNSVEFWMSEQVKLLNSINEKLDVMMKKGVI